MPPAIVHCGYFRRQSLPNCDESDRKMFSKNSVAASIDEAVELTIIRRRFLFQFSNPGDELEKTVQQQISFTLWQINTMPRDFPSEWLLAIANELCKDNFLDMIVGKYLTEILKETCDDAHIRWTDNIFGMLINFSELSIQFRVSLFESGVFGVLVAFIARTSKHLMTVTTRQEVLLGYSLALLLNLSKNTPVTGDFDLCQALHCLLGYDRSTYIPVVASMCLVHCSAVDKRPNVQDFSGKCGTLTMLLDYFTSSSLSDNRRFRGISLIEITDCLNLIARTDADKMLLMKEHAILNSISNLLYSTVEDEQSIGLDFLLNLCTGIESIESNICQIVLAGEADCIQQVRRMSTGEYGERLAEKSNKALNYLNEHVERFHPPVRRRSASTPLSGYGKLKGGKVFLSYYHRDWPTVKRIERLLANSKFEIANPIVAIKSFSQRLYDEKMTTADIVAICYSEGYNMSVVCHTEADRAVALRKKIVAVRIDEDCEPDGWLDELLERWAVLHIEACEDILSSKSKKKLLEQLAKLLIYDA